MHVLKYKNEGVAFGLELSVPRQKTLKSQSYCLYRKSPLFISCKSIFCILSTFQYLGTSSSMQPFWSQYNSHRKTHLSQLRYITISGPRLSVLSVRILTCVLINCSFMVHEQCQNHELEPMNVHKVFSCLCDSMKKSFCISLLIRFAQSQPQSPGMNLPNINMLKKYIQTTTMIITQ